MFDTDLDFNGNNDFLADQLSEWFPFLNESYFWSYSFLGNSLVDYLVAVLVFLLSLAVFKVFREVVLARLASRTQTDIDDTLIEIFRSIKPPFYFILSVYVTLLVLAVPAGVIQAVYYLLLIWVAYQAAVAGNILTDFLVSKKLAKDKQPQTQSALSVLARVAKGVIWVMVVLFVLSNMGINITSFVATLGIGGLAVALALQNILNDLFSSFSIYFDKPFEVGDFIVVGEHLGTVERIGIKSTRLRSLQGEEIVISNQELTSIRVQNFKKLKERRVVFSFGLEYGSPNDKLKQVPEILEKIVTDLDLARFDRAHFYSFGDSSLDFEVVYFLLSPDYNDYMNVQQSINLRLKEEIEKIGLNFAFPTRVIYQR